MASHKIHRFRQFEDALKALQRVDKGRWVPTARFSESEGFLAILEKNQSLFEITGGGMKTSSSIALDSNTMGSFGHSNATILTSIPVNDNKQPPNTQYSSSYASGPDAYEFGTNIINPRIVMVIPITKK
jgi:hypothetical protein